MNQDFSFSAGAKLGAALSMAMGALAIFNSLALDFGEGNKALLMGLLGALIFIFSLMGLRAPKATAAVFAVTLVLGLLLAISPFLFKLGSSYPIAYLSMLPGLLTFIFSAFALGESLELNIPVGSH